MFCVSGPHLGGPWFDGVPLSPERHLPPTNVGGNATLRDERVGDWGQTLVRLVEAHLAMAGRLRWGGRALGAW